MSIEPIRPGDHSIDGNEPSVFAAVDELVWTPQIPALIEAIHQTFERDAESIEALRSMYPNETGMPSFSRIQEFRPDPDTEIDRLARLIVQGEYRRRAEQEKKND